MVAVDASDPCVVNQDIDPTPGVDRPAAGGLRDPGFGHVADLQTYVGAGVRKLGGRSFAEGGVDVDDEDPRALGAEPLGYAVTDARSRSGHYRDLVFKSRQDQPLLQLDPLVPTPPSPPLDFGSGPERRFGKGLHGRESTPSPHTPCPNALPSSPSRRESSRVGTAVVGNALISTGRVYCSCGPDPIRLACEARRCRERERNGTAITHQRARASPALGDAGAGQDDRTEGSYSHAPAGTGGAVYSGLWASAVSLHRSATIGSKTDQNALAAPPISSSWPLVYEPRLRKSSSV